MRESLTPEQVRLIAVMNNHAGGIEPDEVADTINALVATVEAQATQLADARAERDAALDVIGAVDAVVRHKLHIDLDTMIPEWTDRQRYAIRRARWSHPASDDLLASPSGTPTGTHPQAPHQPGEICTCGLGGCYWNDRGPSDPPPAPAGTHPQEET